jgi:hypothetical protein
MLPPISRHPSGFVHLLLLISPSNTGYVLLLSTRMRCSLTPWGIDAQVPPDLTEVDWQKPQWRMCAIDVNTSCLPERSPTALWPNGLIIIISIWWYIRYYINWYSMPLQRWLEWWAPCYSHKLIRTNIANVDQYKLLIRIKVNEYEWRWIFVN